MVEYEHFFIKTNTQNELELIKNNLGISPGPKRALSNAKLIIENWIR